MQNKFTSPIINSGTYGIKERDSAIIRGTKTEKNSSRMKESKNQRRLNEGKNEFEE